MNFQHKELAAGRWQELDLVEQLANIGSEVERAILWKEKKNPEYATKAIERVLELMYLTIADPKNKSRLRELARLKEALTDYFYSDNRFGSSDQLWRNYFLAFAFAARRCLEPAGNKTNPAQPGAGRKQPSNSN
ncbi:MAG: hypothetical protein ABIL25_01575 [candidate division WOR-3 bacterium]